MADPSNGNVYRISQTMDLPAQFSWISAVSQLYPQEPTSSVRPALSEKCPGGRHRRALRSGWWDVDGSARNDAGGPIWRNLRPMRAASAPRRKCPGRPGLALRGKQLAPATRADVALNEFARARRLEIDAAVAVLIAIRRTLIFRVRLADLLLRCRLRDRRSDRRRAECKRGAGERDTA
jgi:hypothetical protein